MSLQHNAAQYDSWLPAWALPPPLMCLHFHPMAVSRWFSAASLKQVSNMAITGSGSLAISLSAFVISAAFLLKGKFSFSSCCCCCFSLSCVCMRVMQNYLYPQLKLPGEYRGEVVMRLRAGCAQASPWNLSITFCCSHAAVDSEISNVLSTLFAVLVSSF